MILKLVQGHVLMLLSLKGLWYIRLCFKEETRCFHPLSRCKEVGSTYILVNSKTAHLPPPPHHLPRIWLEFSTVQWRIWPKIRPAQSGIWLSCQYRKQRDFVILSTFSMCTTFMGHGAFARLWKIMSDVGFMEWNEQTYVRQLSETLDILVVSNAWCFRKFLYSHWWVGDLTLFEVLASGAFDHLNSQHTGNFTKFFQNSQMLGVCLRGWGKGSFAIDQYIMRCSCIF